MLILNWFQSNTFKKFQFSCMFKSFLFCGPQYWPLVWHIWWCCRSSLRQPYNLGTGWTSWHLCRTWSPKVWETILPSLILPWQFWNLNIRMKNGFRKGQLFIFNNLCWKRKMKEPCNILVLIANKKLIWPVRTTTALTLELP